MSAREEKRDAFNEQMNAWVSRQGLWFQLRHAADGQTIVARMMRILMRFAVLLLIAILGFWIYLVKRVEGPKFKENIRASVESALKGKDCKVGAFRKEREVATLAYAKMEGTEESFFHSLDVRGIRTSMKLTDGLLGSWEGQSLMINRLDADIKAGGSSNDDAATAFNSLFVAQNGFKFDRIECENTNIEWGYSEHNRGFITGSHLIAGRENGGWKLEFKGGTFGQNWLSHLAIRKMVVLCYPQGISIQEAELTANDGKGSITFRLSVGSGSQPSVAGTIQISSMPLDSLLPANFTEWIEGSISGKGLISGSTNSQEGIILDLDLKMGDGDVMSVRDAIPLLSALTVVDLYNSYRKVSFDEGSFHVRTGGKLLSISQFNLKAGDLLYLQGAVDVRPPSNIEIAKALDIENVEVVRDILENNWKHQSDQLKETMTGSSLSSKKEKASSDSGARKLNTVQNVLRAGILAELNVKRFEGSIKLGLKPDAFDKAPKLKEVYPVDVKTDRIWVKAPLNGRLQTLTLSQAEQMYILGRNRE